MSTLLDVPVNLDAFAAKGGKLLLAHGLVDVLVSARATEEYYQRLQARMGAAKSTSSFATTKRRATATRSARHFNAAWDSLTALENWVAEGTAPRGQVDDRHRGAPGRTRPLCEYPKWARYNGSGDVNLAASFTCVDSEAVPPTQRQTALGTVVGTDHSATSGTYAWKGVPFARRRSATCAGSRRSTRRLDHARSRSSSATPACSGSRCTARR